MNSAETKKKRSSGSQVHWHLVTNHMNVLYMLAAGLVMEPAGFRGKHYTDSLGMLPGWVPLLRDVLPAQAFDLAESERKFLRPCIMQFDLSGVSSPVKVLAKNGKIRTANFPKSRLGNTGLSMLFPAPLSLSLLSKVIFCTEEDKQLFVTAAKDVANVNLDFFCIHVDESQFITATDDAWPSDISEKAKKNSSKKESQAAKQASLLDENTEAAPEVSIANNSIVLSSQSIGGVLAVLYHTANQVDLGSGLYNLITGSGCEGGDKFSEDPILAELPYWLKGGRARENADPRAELFWGAVTALDNAVCSEQSREPVEAILEYLDTQLAQLNDERFRLRLERLIEDMRSTLGLSGATITELFERHKGSLSRPLLLFCLRKRSAELLEFSHPSFEPEERLLSSILFGVRDSWLKLPKELRTKALSDYVSYRMVEASQSHQEHGLSLPVVSAPIPLRVLFSSELGQWSRSQEEAALALAESSNWRQCIESTISSVGGEPLEPPRQDDGSFIFTGALTMKVKIDREVFLELLGQWPPVSAELDAMVRGQLIPKKVLEVAEG